jgi:hypothetical protein
MELNLPKIKASEVKPPHCWVRKLDSEMWWVGEAVYPDWITGIPKPGDLVFIYDKKYVIEAEDP